MLSHAIMCGELPRSLLAGSPYARSIIRRVNFSLIGLIKLIPLPEYSIRHYNILLALYVDTLRVGLKTNLIDLFEKEYITILLDRF